MSCDKTKEAARNSMEKNSESQGQGLLTSPDSSAAASRLQAQQAFDFTATHGYSALFDSSAFATHSSILGGNRERYGDSELRLA